MTYSNLFHPLEYIAGHWGWVRKLDRQRRQWTLRKYPGIVGSVARQLVTTNLRENGRTKSPQTRGDSSLWLFIYIAQRHRASCL